jgi:predicted amidophosphoribosyltransferase
VGLGASERRSNVEGVFAVERTEAVRGKTLLLIDDVVTTGATCHEAARTLQDAGAREVSVLALAREPFRH